MRRKPLLKNRQRKLHQAIIHHYKTGACEVPQCVRIANLVGLNSAPTPLCRGDRELPEDRLSLAVAKTRSQQRSGYEQADQVAQGVRQLWGLFTQVTAQQYGEQGTSNRFLDGLGPPGGKCWGVPRAQKHAQ